MTTEANRSRESRCGFEITNPFGRELTAKYETNSFQMSVHIGTHETVVSGHGLHRAVQVEIGPSEAGRAEKCVRASAAKVQCDPHGGNWPGSFTVTVTEGNLVCVRRTGMRAWLKSWLSALCAESLQD